MNFSSHLRLLVDHNQWASLRVVDQLLRLDAIPSRAEWLMNHLLHVECIWYDRFTGQSQSCDETIQKHRWHERLDAVHEGWTALIENEPHRTATYTNSKGFEFSNSLPEIITHVSLHGQYHRGQIIALIRPIIEQPPATDMIVFLRESAASL